MVHRDDPGNGFGDDWGYGHYARATVRPDGVQVTA